MITRRNFVLGVRNAGILALLPPALTMPQLKKQSELIVEAKGPELFRGSIEGIADGPIIMSSVPEPHCLSINHFTLETFTIWLDGLAKLGAVPQRVPALTESSIKAWIRSETKDLYSYLGKTVHISAQASKGVFYSGNFMITEVRQEYENQSAAAGPASFPKSHRGPSV